jgi:hypothetical protein
MKKSAAVVLLLLTAWLCPAGAGANSLYSRAEGFNVPDGDIAYLGSYYDPVPVLRTGADDNPARKVKKIRSSTRLLTSKNAVAETNEAVLKKAEALKISLEEVEYNEAGRKALVNYLLDPEGSPKPAGLAALCGDKPYALVAVVDFYTDYHCSINIRENQNGRKIDYLGLRSIIEIDQSFFRVADKQSAVGLELFLISAKNGKLLWQGNMMTTGVGLWGGYPGITQGLVEGALKNLFKK